MTSVENLKVKIYADGANLDGMLEMYKLPYVKGFTTNPTLMRQANIEDYEAFAKKVIAAIPDRPLSFEVFADDFENMERQALKIKSWGGDVYVKIPVMNTKKEPTYGLIKRLTEQKVVLNVTAIFSLEQVRFVTEAMRGAPKGIISVFAGRIADTGVDPVPHMIACKKIIDEINPNLELLWASPREMLNIMQADEIGCDIITVTNGILSKLSNVGKALDEFSHETVEMFYKDATSAGYSI